MNTPECPAAYLGSDPAAGAMTVRQAAAGRGWPEPDLYAERPGHDGPGEALAGLTAAIEAGRHDAVLVSIRPASDPAIRQLQAACRRRDIPVAFVARESRTGPVSGPAARRGSGPARHHATGTLDRAAIEALGEQFPDWRFWHDRHGWHARRRDGHIQYYRPGAPAFHVSAPDVLGLAAQLCWQRAAEIHTPHGCAQGRLAEESGLSR